MLYLQVDVVHADFAPHCLTLMQSRHPSLMWAQVCVCARAHSRCAHTYVYLRTNHGCRCSIFFFRWMQGNYHQQMRPLLPLFNFSFLFIFIFFFQMDARELPLANASIAAVVQFFIFIYFYFFLSDGCKGTAISKCVHGCRCRKGYPY